MKETIIPFCDKIKFEIIRSSKIQDIVYDEIQIKFNLGKLPISFNISRKNYLKLKKVCEKVIVKIYNLSPITENKKSVLLTEINPNEYEYLINELSKKGKPLEIGRIVAELNLGFWINLYDRPYMEFQKQSIKNQFPNATNRQRDIFKIKDRLNDIRLLRNRIFHYEPIWHWTDLNTYFQEIKELLQWINKDLCLKSFEMSEKEFLEQFKRQETLLK